MQYRTIHFHSPSDTPPGGAEFAGQVVLSDVEVRVLSCLVEKETTTPDYYPLTLNSLVAACNQKTSRDPVVSYSDDTVQSSLDSLQEKGLTHRITSSGGKVPRYRHLFFEAFRLNRAQGAVLCMLMLRSAQTVGEIRQHSNRIHDFASLEEVEETLQSLMALQERPLVTRLERQAGTKEYRYAHLLEGEARGLASQLDNVTAPEAEGSEKRIEVLEERVASLREVVDQLQAEFAKFRKQFD